MSTFISIVIALVVAWIIMAPLFDKIGDFIYKIKSRIKGEKNECQKEKLEQ